MKASKLLRQVRNDMVNDNGSEYVSKYICDNVRSIGSKSPAKNKTAERICAHINELLGGLFSLREWLAVNGHYPNMRPWRPTKYNFHYLGKVDQAKLQATRHAWLADMIVYFETKGD